jgi:hypothetical protein
MTVQSESRRFASAIPTYPVPAPISRILIGFLFSFVVAVVVDGCGSEIAVEVVVVVLVVVVVVVVGFMGKK